MGVSLIGLAITKYVFKLNIQVQSYKIPIKREQKNEFYLPSVRNLSNFSDFKALYTSVVTDDYPRSQLDKVVETLKDNAEKRICTLFHCTAGKDRTGIVSMALLKSYGVSDEEIIEDYMRTNRNAFWPTMKKCVGVGLLTRDWSLVKTAYRAFMAQRELIETAINHYTILRTWGYAMPESTSSNMRRPT